MGLKGVVQNNKEQWLLLIGKCIDNECIVAPAQLEGSSKISKEFRVNDNSYSLAWSRHRKLFFSGAVPMS